MAITIKSIDLDDSYTVREMFGCGHGHVLPPGFTHWESGEACPLGHSSSGPSDNKSYHLYWRLVCVPIVDMRGNDMWEKLCSYPNRWAHLPLAPPGLQEGARIGTKLKMKREEVSD